MSGVAHFSIKEYLMSDRISYGPSAYARFTEAECNLHIAGLCMAYHMLYAMDHPDRGFELRSYATENWPRHLEEVPSDIWPLEIVDLARRALGIRSQSMDAMISVFWYRTLLGDRLPDLDFQPYPTILRPYCFTGRLGFVRLTDMLLSSHRYLTQEDLDAVLHEGAYGNQIAIVRRMLERGAHVNALHPVAGSALHAAAMRGHVAVAEFLLERGAEIDVQLGEQGTALHVASSNGRLAVIKTLIQYGADVNFEGGEYGTALQAACASGEDDAALLLLENGTNAHQRGGRYGSAWHAAAAHLGRYDYTHDTILTALLDHGVDVNDTQGQQHATALQAALELKMPKLPPPATRTAATWTLWTNESD